MTEKTHKDHERLNSYTHKVGGFDLPLYTTPQQRTWFGLTDEEIQAVNAQVSQIPPIDYTTTTYAKAIEAKLKEKNNG
jgi:cellobiose-specific phosphotransferase system component IIB